MQYRELTGVPIFCTGLHRGEYYGPERIRRMVANSNRMRPYFRGVLKTKLTHGDQQPDLLQQAALGQAARYYLRKFPGGLAMMGDFSGVPAPVADAAAHHFPNVSVEKYRYFTANGQRVPDVVKSVAFLGADAPEVKGLKLAYPDIFQDAYGEIEHFEGANTMNGAEITAQREALGMSVEDLAAIVGIDAATLEGIEAGTMEPEPDVLEAIGQALAMNADENQAGAEPPAKFSEADVQAAVDRAVANTHAALNAKIDGLIAQLQAKDAEIFKEQQTARQQRIAARLDALLLPGPNGLAFPSIARDGLRAFMERLGDDVEQFGETEASPLEYFAGLLETVRNTGLVDTRTLAEPGKSPQRAKPDTLQDAIEAFKETNPAAKHMTYGQIWDKVAADNPALVIA